MFQKRCPQCDNLIPFGSKTSLKRSIQRKALYSKSDKDPEIFYSTKKCEQLDKKLKKLALLYA